jgi:hypothetical protein
MRSQALRLSCKWQQKVGNIEGSKQSKRKKPNKVNRKILQTRLSGGAVLARVSRNRKLHVRDDTNYQVLVYPTLTDAPPCWLQLAPALKELLALEEDSEEEKESISKSCCCICN